MNEAHCLWEEEEIRVGCCFYLWWKRFCTAQSVRPVWGSVQCCGFALADGHWLMLESWVVTVWLTVYMAPPLSDLCSTLPSTQISNWRVLVFTTADPKIYGGKKHYSAFFEEMTIFSGTERIWGKTNVNTLQLTKSLESSFNTPRTSFSILIFLPF